MGGRVSEFLSRGPDVRLEDEFADIYRLLADFGYYSALLGRSIWVPKDFLTDFASVPRWFFAYWALGNKGKRAALIHDGLYSGLIADVTRDKADLVLREALLASGYSIFTAAAMYAGVRIGGASRFEAPNVPQEPHVTAEMEAP